MKGFARILLYYFTWRSVISGMVVGGALLMVAALNALLLSPYVAFTISVLSFMGLLVAPFLSASLALRHIISSRSLGLIPYFALKAGLALLLLTLLTSAFLPMMGWLAGRPLMTLSWAPKLFVIASLFCALMQLLLPSRFLMVGFSVLPFAVVLLVNRFGLSLAALADNKNVVLAAVLLCLAGWAYALKLLAQQRGFKPVLTATSTNFSNYNTMEGFGDMLGINLQGTATAAASLLFAYPASVPVRLFNVGFFVAFSPLLGTWMISLMPTGAGKIALPLVPAFLLMSFFCGCICCWDLGELGARARLLWLRLPGERSRIWRKLEQELWMNFALLAGVLVLIVASVLLINPHQAYLPYYFMIIMACAFFDSYLNLCARLYQWPSLVQALVLLVSLGSIIVAVFYSLRFPEFSVLNLLAAGLLLLALLFRSLAKLRFSSVDWLVLKHEISRRVAQS